jgi:hypothetical protein
MSGGVNPITQSLPSGIQSIGQAVSQSSDQLRGLDYTQLSEQQRKDFNGLSRGSAAIIHLGGRANISGAMTANFVSPSAQIYNNVINDPDHFHPEEVEMVKKFREDEIKRRGMVTGENLDNAFIDEMGARNNMDPGLIQHLHDNVNQRVQQMMANPNRNAVMADLNKPLNLVDDISTLQNQSGLNKTEQAAFRLGGHSVLFSGDGRVNGDILGLTLGNTNALDNKGAGNNGSIDAETQAIAQADMADDGKLNGSSLRDADQAVLQKLYDGGKGISNNQAILDRGIAVGKQNGRTPQQIQQAITSGTQQALNDFKQMAKNHSPAMLALGTTMAGAAAVCPFLGGMAAGAAGIGAAQKMMQPKSA